ncbi:hypothetical protein ACGFX4_34880 [Kitasatospora sp. NPDC048365]|uniref:hypothetical protein n=1 Tax=Kitasatospora sp. NPDC048365 TaxID=3364050 RepID=UPI00371B0FB8
MESAMRYRLWCGAAAALVAVVTLTGCGRGPAAPADGPTATAAPTAATAEPAPQDLLVEVTVSGGFAGVDNSVVVHTDGAYTIRVGSKPPRSGQLAPAELAELRAALADPAYAKLPARPTGPPIADGFQYLVTSGHRQIVAADGDRPPALARVLGALPEGGPPTGR